MHFFSRHLVSRTSDCVTTSKAFRSKRSDPQQRIAGRCAGRTVLPALTTPAPAAWTAGDRRLAAARARKCMAQRETGEGATHRIRPLTTCGLRPQPQYLQPAKCAQCRHKRGSLGLPNTPPPSAASVRYRRTPHPHAAGHRELAEDNHHHHRVRTLTPRRQGLGPRRHTALTNPPSPHATGPSLNRRGRHAPLPSGKGRGGYGVRRCVLNASAGQ